MACSQHCTAQYTVNKTLPCLFLSDLCINKKQIIPQVPLSPNDLVLFLMNRFPFLCSLKIGMIVNLQEPGEHALCGDGIIAEVGFSYNPEHL